jgi:nucleoside-diphosphate-sugar epimerase
VHDARRALEELIEGSYLILAATQGAPNRYLAEPLETLELNGPGLFSWLEWAERSKSPSVLYLSSGEVYGSPELDGPTPEGYAGRIDPVLERSVYAESKRYGEAVTMAFHRARRVPVRIARPFQVFGPGIRSGDGRAMSAFLRAAAAGEAIRLESAGTAIRTFLYLADATVAFWKILIAGEPGGVYNVGATEPEVSIAALAERIAYLSGGSARTVIGGAAASNAPARTCPDVTRLREELGFEPRYSLDDLITRTLAWLQTETAC